MAIQPESLYTGAHLAWSAGRDVLWSDIYDRLDVMPKMSGQTRDFEDMIAAAAATHPVPNTSLYVISSLTDEINQPSSGLHDRDSLHKIYYFQCQ